MVDKAFVIGARVAVRDFKFERCPETGAPMVHGRNEHMCVLRLAGGQLLPKSSACAASGVDALTTLLVDTVRYAARAYGTIWT